jgi:hypothetical protein
MLTSVKPFSIHLKMCARNSPILVGSLNLIWLFPPDRRWRIAVDTNPSIFVVLSDDLLSHLRRVAQEKQIPLRWLVAGLVCDTFESGIDRSGDRQGAHKGS